MALEDLVKGTIEEGTPPGIERLGILGMGGEGIKVIPKIIGAIIHKLAMMGQFLASISGDDEIEKGFSTIVKKANTIGKGVTTEDVKGFMTVLTELFTKGTPAIGVPGMMAGTPLTPPGATLPGTPPTGTAPSPGTMPPPGAIPPGGLGPTGVLASLVGGREEGGATE